MPSATHYLPGQEELFATPDAPATEFPELTGTVVVDVETFDPRLFTHGPGWCFGATGGYIVGVGVAAPGFSRYYAVRHAAGDNPYNATQTFRWLRDQLKKPDVFTVTHGGMYDEGWLAQEGVRIRNKHDTMVMAALLDEYRRSYALDSLAADYTGIRKDEGLLREYAIAHKLHPKKDLWRMPWQVVEPYGRGDAVAELALFHKLLPLLTLDDLLPVYTLEMELHPVLLAMRERGVRVNVDAAEQTQNDLRTALRELERELTQLNHGKPVDVWAPRSCAEALQRDGVSAKDFRRTAITGALSVTAPWLKSIADRSKVAAAIVRQRSLEKVQGTFIQNAILKHLMNGRIHCEFHQLRQDTGSGMYGAVSGRFSSSKPNLQQLPSRDSENAKLVRSLFLPEINEQWISADYSQQEPRLMVHYGDVFKLPSVRDWVEAYRTNPNLDFYDKLMELSGLPRKDAKNAALGRAYGMGALKFCLTYGFPVREVIEEGEVRLYAGEEGRTIMEQLDRHVPFIRQLSEAHEREAKQRGFIKTILGRKCRFKREVWSQEDQAFRVVAGTEQRAYTYKALNRRIQGSAADQMKRAMIEKHRAGVPLLVTVHDETGASGDRATARTIEQIMLDCVPLSVPSKVDIAMGESWGATL